MAVILLVPCCDEKVFVNDGIEMFFDGFAGNLQRTAAQEHQ